jgi:hypothetical protein
MEPNDPFPISYIDFVGDYDNKFMTYIVNVKYPIEINKITN